MRASTGAADLPGSAPGVQAILAFARRSSPAVSMAYSDESREQVASFNQARLWCACASLGDSMPPWPVISAETVRPALCDEGCLIDGMSPWRAQFLEAGARLCPSGRLVHEISAHGPRPED